MDSVEHLRELYAWDDWANRRIYVVLKSLPSERCVDLLTHIVTTKQEYFRRLYGNDSTGFEFWPDIGFEELGDLIRKTAEDYEKLLGNFHDEGLGLKTRYKTSEGVEYSNSFREILSHVLFHSAAHRGDIIATMRREGIEPPKVDYIIYLRETAR